MLTPNRELKRMAWNSLRGNWGNAMLTLIVFLLISYASIIIPFGTILIGAPLSIGLVLYFLRLSRGQEVRTGLIFKPFNFYGNSLLAWFLKTIIILLAAAPLIIALVIYIFSFDLYDNFDPTNAGRIFSLTIILLILYILPLFVMIRLALVYYIVADYNNLAADRAISISWKAMKGKEWKLLGLYLSFIGWFLLGIITLGIAYLWAVPYLDTSLANFYNDIKQNDDIDLIVANYLHTEEQPPVIEA